MRADTVCNNSDYTNMSVHRGISPVLNLPSNQLGDRRANGSIRGKQVGGCWFHCYRIRVLPHNT